MNKQTLPHQLHLTLLICLCSSLVGCQLPPELFPETTKYQAELRQKKTQEQALPTPAPKPRPFKKVTQEERDRAERAEYDRKKCREAFETLRAFS
jgi:hypothetical protein